MSIVGLVAALTIRSINDGDKNVVSIKLEYQELYSYPVGTTVLSQLICAPVKMCLISTPATYYEICPIKVSTRL